MDALSSQPWWKSFEAKLLLGAFLFRLLYLATILDNPYFLHPITDEQMYDTWAQALVAGETDHEEYPYFDPPLHAYFLASIYWAFGPNLLAVRLVHIIFGTLNVFLLYRIGSRLLTPTAAKITGILAATYLPFLYYEGLLLKDSVALFLLNLVLLLILRALSDLSPLSFAVTGMALGLLTLTRVNALALIPACLILMWIRNAPLVKSALPFLLGISLLIAPATIRNYLVSGEWVLISAYGGQVLYNGNNPSNATGDYMPVPGVRPNPAYERMDFHRLAEKQTGKTMTPMEVSTYWRDQALGFALRHPLTQAKMVGWRILRFWNYQELPDNHSFEQFQRFSWILRMPLPGLWLIAPFALTGLFLFWPHRSKFAALYLFLGWYSLSLLPFWIFSRYRLPIVGVLILFAAPAILHWFQMGQEALKQKQWSPLLKPGLLLVMVVIICWLPLPNPSHSNTERNLAYAYEQSREYDKAIAIYRTLQTMESNVENELFLANALGLSGRTKEALTRFHKLQNPNQPKEIRQHAFNLQGDLARSRGEWAEAEQAYRRALALDPGDYGGWNNLAISLAGQGYFSEADKALQRAVEIDPESGLAQRNQVLLQQFRARLKSSTKPLQGPTPTTMTQTIRE